MTNKQDNTNIKITWCRSHYGKYLIDNKYSIRDVHPCRYGEECRGAHTISELREKDNIVKWRKMNKNHINILKIKHNIISVIISSQEQVKNMKFRCDIKNINDLDFPNLLKFWYDITSYHRKISKQLPPKKYLNNYNKDEIDGFTFKEEVPQFHLKNEDYVWAIERTFHFCPKYKYLTNNKNKSQSIRHICCGGINCKNGIHDIKHLACIEDLMTGKCSCLSEKEYENVIEQNEKQIVLYQNQLDGKTDKQGFYKKLVERKENKCMQKFQNLNIL